MANETVWREKRTRYDDKWHGQKLRHALMSMIREYAYWNLIDGGCYCTGGVPALKEAFAVLGYDDLIPVAEARSYAEETPNDARRPR